MSPAMNNEHDCLVVGLPLDPGSGTVPSQQILSALIVDEDKKREGHGWDPPVDVERVHPQSLVHARGVGEEGSEDGLEAETKVHEVILHTLLEDGVLPCLTDDQVSPLDNDNGDKEGCVASVLQDL